MQSPPTSLDLRTIAVAISGAALGLLAAWALVGSLSGSGKLRSEANAGPPPRAGLASPPALPAVAAEGPSEALPAVAAEGPSEALPAVADTPSTAMPARTARGRDTRLPIDPLVWAPDVSPPCDAGSRARRGIGDAQIRPVHDGGRMLGLQVLEVTEDTFWHDLGLASGDVIFEHDGAPVDAPQASVELLREIEEADRLWLTVQNAAGEVRTVHWDAPEGTASPARCP